MKTLLTIAALAVTVTSASAGTIPLNSDGERKYDHASRVQAERGEGAIEFDGAGGGLDMTATQSFEPGAAGGDRLTIRRMSDGNDGTIVEFSRLNAQGQRVVVRTVHYPS